MTPHQVVSLLTQDETQGLMTACSQYLSPERIFSALQEGLDKEEIEALCQLMKDYFIDSSDED